MDYILFAISILSAPAQNYISNKAAKSYIHTNSELHNFNVLRFLSGFLIFLIISIGKPLHMYTVLMGAAFGVMCLLQGVSSMKAFATGPMFMTVIIQTSSMIVPAISDAFYGKTLSAYKIAAMILLIGFMCIMTVSKSEDKKSVSLKWFIYAFVSFASIAGIGLMQKVFNASDYASESTRFLAVAFLTSMIVSCAQRASAGRLTLPSKNVAFMGIALGVLMYVNHHINLVLAGRMDSQIFFPIGDGAPLILSTLVALLIFKEKLTVRQKIGLAGSVIAILALCLLP